MKKKIALFVAIMLLLPTVLSGCVSADELAERRAKTDEIGKQAEEYMRGKYNRGFKVKKCEFAVGDEYEGDFFITFNNDVHAFYNGDEEKFYDDRQTSVLNDDLYNDVWMPLIKDINLVYDNIGNWSQDFNLVYRYTRGGEEFKYCMYHDYYYGGAQRFAMNNYISVTTENLILVSDMPQTSSIRGKINECMTTYFKGKNNDVKFYIVNSAYHKSYNFDPATVDETVDGCLTLISYRDKIGTTNHQFVPVDGVEGLYAMICGDNGYTFKKGDIALTPVSNSDATAEAIRKNMDGKDMNLVDKYVTKKRSINFEQPIYQVELSYNAKSQNYDEYTLAFVMKDSDEEITEYADIKERERSFFGYNMDGDFYNATCLTSPNSRSVKFTYGKKDNAYFWFGTQS